MNLKSTILLGALHSFLSFATYASDTTRLYPAKKSDSWGFIDAKGQWKIPPTYVDFRTMHRNPDWYFMVKKKDNKFDLEVLDKYGHELLTLKDTMKYNNDYDFKQSNYGYRKVCNILLKQNNLDTLFYSIHSRQREWEHNFKPYLSGRYSKNGRNRDLDTLHYNLGRMSDLGFAKCLGAKLYLINKGGYSMGEFKEGYHYKSGCVVRDEPDRFINIKTYKGTWSIVHKNGTLVYDIGPLDTPEDVQTIYSKSGRDRIFLEYLYIRKKEGESNLFTFLNTVGDSLFTYSTDKPSTKVDVNQIASTLTTRKPYYFAVSFHKEYQSNRPFKTFLLSFDGKTIVDTFESMQGCGTDAYLAKKDGLWKLYDHKTHLAKYPNSIKVNEEIVGLGESKIRWKTKDSCHFYNFENNESQSYRIDDREDITIKAGYRIHSKITGEKFLTNKEGKVLFETTRSYLHFEPCKSFIDLGELPDHNAQTLAKFKGNYDGKYPTSRINNLFTVDDHYFTKYKDYALDTNFRQVYISSYKVVESYKNGFIQIKDERGRGYEHTKTYSLYHNNKVIATKMSEAIPIISRGSEQFTILALTGNEKLGNQYLIYLKEVNKYVRIKTYDSYGYRTNYSETLDKFYDNLLQFGLEDDEWFYITSVGEVIYSSISDKKITPELISPKKMKKMKKIVRKYFNN